LEVLEQLVRYHPVDQEQLVANHLEDLDHLEKAHQEVQEAAFHLEERMWGLDLIL
jgi:hypothetical protein